MNRKQAKQAGGQVWKSWQSGYKYMQSYANGKLERGDFMWLISEDLLDAEVRKPVGWPTSYFYGRIAAMKNILKKGKYSKT